MPVFTHFLSRKPCIPKYGFGTFWDDSQKKKRMESGEEKKEKTCPQAHCPRTSFPYKQDYGSAQYIFQVTQSPSA